MSATSNTTTLRPLYAQQHDKNGRRCSSATRRLEIDRAAWSDAREGDAAHLTPGNLHRPVHWVTTTDHATGDAVQVAVAPCGLGCRCAAAWRRA
jgi:hypothetical protein